MRKLCLILIIAIFGLSACGSSQASSDQKVRVVAAENFYGSIAREIGGDHVDVTSILSSPDADPHMFEPDSSNGLAVSKAQVVIANGLDYDSFIDNLVSASPNSNRQVITMANVLGRSGAETNPHLWYDVDALPQIATAIADALAKTDTANADDYRAGAEQFVTSLSPLTSAVSKLKQTHAGEGVAMTEPVAGYLVQDAGLVDKSPAEFTRAIEEGSDPSIQATAAINSLMTQRQVGALIYNNQTVDDITRSLSAVAKTNGVPVVGVSETQPEGRTFVQWQLEQVQALQAALDK